LGVMGLIGADNLAKKAQLCKRPLSHARHTRSDHAARGPILRNDCVAIREAAAARPREKNDRYCGRVSPKSMRSLSYDRGFTI
jgi:hypothetical protein